MQNIWRLEYVLCILMLRKSLSRQIDIFIFLDLSTLLTFSYVRPRPKSLRYWTNFWNIISLEALQKFLSSSSWIEVQIFLCFRDPIRYFNSTKGRNLTKMVICKYILPILVISLLANSPTLFEFQVLTQSQVAKKFDPVANQTLEVDYLKLVGLTFIYIAQKLFQTCEVAYSVAGTWLKFNQFYVTFYKNFVRSFLFGVLPFIILVILNWKIYYSIQSSDRRYPNLMFKQPLVLFAICFLFLITHSVRIILAFHRLIYREQFAKALENICNPHQLWTLTAASVSRLLLIFNSSVNFAIYCFISRDFRVSVLQVLQVFFCHFVKLLSRLFWSFLLAGNILTKVWKVQIWTSRGVLHGQKTRKHFYNYTSILNLSYPKYRMKYKLQKPTSP